MLNNKFRHINSALFASVLITLSGLFSCSGEKDQIARNQQIIEVECDLEKTDGSVFICNNGDEISGASRQSNEVARSGKFSAKISSKRNYALHYKFAPIELGDEIIVSIWRYKSKTNFGALKISTGKAKTYYLTEGKQTSGKWELIEKHIRISSELSDSLLDIFVFNKHETPTYFDDLKIKIIKNGGFSIVDHPELEQVNIKVKPKNFAKLVEKRKEALQKKILISNNDDWVKAKINWDDDQEKCKIRLKGDWTDHLAGKKWSLRINISNNKKVNGFTRFSIQNPPSRGYLSEWFIHKVLISEGILTTRFEFINFKLNGKVKGLYSVEEHFTNDLLISQNKKKGVILKFDEDPMWQYRSEHHKNKKGIPLWYPSSEIFPFRNNSTTSNPVLFDDFLKSRDLLFRFQQHYGEVDEIFDLNQMAKFLASVDVFMSYHGLIWHNLRFYYNPETEKLEPIAYDLFSSDILNSPYPGFMAYNFLIGKNYRNYDIYREFFRNQTFLDKYLTYLGEYSSVSFLEEQLSENQSEIEFYENEIRKEYRFYRFNIQHIFNNAEMIREKLPELIKNKKKLLSAKPTRQKRINPDAYSYLPVNNQSLKAYSFIVKNKAILQLRNFFYKQLIVQGYVVGTDTIYLDDSIEIDPYLHDTRIKTTRLSTDFLIDEVLYRVEGDESGFSQKTIPYRSPE